MDDETLRSLEREIQSGDMGARARLTEFFLSSGSGQVCLWRPPKPAPPGAVRVSLRLASVGGTVRAEGLALAVLDAADAISLVKTAGDPESWEVPVELIDLASGDCVRAMPSQDRPILSAGGGQPTAARIYETPLWDRMLVPARRGETWFFHYPPGLTFGGFQKCWSDTNLSVPNHLPGNMREFRVDGISAIPDAFVDEAALRTVRDHGRFRLRDAGQDLIELPVRMLVPLLEERAGAMVLERSAPVHRLRNVISLNRIVHATIFVDGPEAQSEASPVVGLMVVLHGVGLVPL